MLAFIDDSGDPGFKLDRGSTKVFVIAIVIFDDELEAENTSVAIKNLKRKLHLPDEMEFKFCQTSSDYKEQFFREINRFKFRIRGLVVYKEKIYSPKLKNNKESFYNYCIKEVLKYNNNTINGADIKIDGSGSKEFRKGIKSYLRKQLNNEEKHILKSCKLVDSKENSLIQLADMVAGAINRSCDSSKADSQKYIGIIKRHIQDIWSFQ